MALFISVINHNHDSMICSNTTLIQLASEHTVILKSNTPATRELQTYCSNNNITLVQGNRTKGFGANNNEIFHYAQNRLGMGNNDHFLVLNPDIEVDSFTVNHLLRSAKESDSSISTINLYRDKNFSIYDNSIRHFPTALAPIKTLLKINRSDYYDKDNITNPTPIEWAAGSFLLFKYEVFNQLGGFNEKYFMYFEDVDICKRAQELGYSIYYFPQYKAVHLAAFSNRKPFSFHAIYYFISYIKYRIRL